MWVSLILSINLNTTKRLVRGNLACLTTWAKTLTFLGLGLEDQNYTTLASLAFLVLKTLKSDWTLHHQPSSPGWPTCWLQIFGPSASWREDDPLYKVAKNLTKLCFSVLWKAELSAMKSYIQLKRFLTKVLKEHLGSFLTAYNKK